MDTPDVPPKKAPRQPRPKIVRKRAHFPREKIVALNLAKCFGDNQKDILARLDLCRMRRKIPQHDEVNVQLFGEEKDAKSSNFEEEKLEKNVSNKTKKKYIPPKKKKSTFKSLGKIFIKDFAYFARLGDKYSSGGTISYPKTLKWLKKAELLDNHRVTMGDVEVHFISKLKNGHELKILEFIHFLKSLCDDRGLHMSTVITKLLKCRQSRKKVKCGKATTVKWWNLKRTSNNQSFSKMKDDALTQPEKNSKRQITKIFNTINMEDKQPIVRNTTVSPKPRNKLTMANDMFKRNENPTEDEMHKMKSLEQSPQHDAKNWIFGYAELISRPIKMGAQDPRSIQNKTKQEVSKWLGPSLPPYKYNEGPYSSQILIAAEVKKNAAQNVKRENSKLFKQRKIEADKKYLEGSIKIDKIKQKLNQLTKQPDLTIVGKSADNNHEYENYDFICSEINLAKDGLSKDGGNCFENESLECFAKDVQKHSNETEGKLNGQIRATMPLNKMMQQNNFKNKFTYNDKEIQKIVDIQHFQNGMNSTFMSDNVDLENLITETHSVKSISHEIAGNETNYRCTDSATEFKKYVNRRTSLEASNIKIKGKVKQNNKKLKASIKSEGKDKGRDKLESNVSDETKRDLLQTELHPENLPSVKEIELNSEKLPHIESKLYSEKLPDIKNNDLMSEKLPNCVNNIQKGMSNGTNEIENSIKRRIKQKRLKSQNRTLENLPIHKGGDKFELNVSDKTKIYPIQTELHSEMSPKSEKNELNSETLSNIENKLNSEKLPGIKSYDFISGKLPICENNVQRGISYDVNEIENSLSPKRSNKKIRLKSQNRTFTNLPVYQVEKTIRKSRKLKMNTDDAAGHSRRKLSKSETTGKEAKINVNANVGNTGSPITKSLNTRKGKHRKNLAINPNDLLHESPEKSSKILKTGTKKHKIRKGTEIPKQEIRDPQTADEEQIK